MVKFKIDDQGMAQLIARCKDVLEVEVEDHLIPFARETVRVDTGRLRESIASSQAQHKKRYKSADGTLVNAVYVEVTFGGSTQTPTARDDGRGSREVDYAVDLDKQTANLQSDIFDGLNGFYA